MFVLGATWLARTTWAGENLGTLAALALCGVGGRLRQDAGTAVPS